MGIQEIITFLIVGVAIFFSGKKFIRQFTHGEQDMPKCANCALNNLKQSDNKKVTKAA